MSYKDILFFYFLLSNLFDLIFFFNLFLWIVFLKTGTKQPLSGVELEFTTSILSNQPEFHPRMNDWIQIYSFPRYFCSTFWRPI